MTTIHAAPQMSRIEFDGGAATAFDLQTALNKAEPGDTVRLAPGCYRDPVTVSFGGRPGAPVTVEGPDLRRGGRPATFDGGRAMRDGLEGGFKPLDGVWSFVKLTGVSHVTFRNIRVRNCWPHAFYVRQCQHLTFGDIDAVGGRRLVFARSGARLPTRGLLLERIRWVQDPEHAMWRGEAAWAEIKEKPGHADKSWFNGGLLESYDIDGDVTITDCDISHAFNAIRMDLAEGAVADGADGPIVRGNRNVRIVGNRFSHIRDNAIEPERGLDGWLVAENLFFQVHATLSVDAVAIRNLAFVCNRALNVSRPDDAGNTGGKIIKFLDVCDTKRPSASVGFVSAFNSVRTRTRYVADAALKPWTDRNNAVERFAASDRDDARLFSKVRWAAGASCDGMATNDPSHPTDYLAAGGGVGRWPALARVFDHEDPEPDMGAALGGWSGALPLTEAARGLPAVAVTVFGADGQPVEIAAEGAPGYRPLAALGFVGRVSPPAA